MKYVSVDIETTGLDPEENDILQVAMVIEDTNDIIPLEKLPFLNIFLEREELRVNTKTLELFRGNFDKWLKADKVDGYDAIEKIEEFLKKYFDEDDRIILAGKNVGPFDLQFLKKLDFWEFMDMRFSHRIIDPAILFVDWKTDDKLPSLSQCLERAGIENTVTHDAYEDALQVIELIRYKIND